MSLKSVLLLFSFAAAAGWALYSPMVGVLAYVLHYHVAPESQWWGQEIAGLGIRYSFALGVATGVTFFLNREQWRFGRSAMTWQEWLILLFVAVIWLSTLLKVATGDTSSREANAPEIKMLKVLIFLLLMTHIVTTRRCIDMVLWVLVAGVAYLGFQASTASRWYFTADGRLTGLGGPDFQDSSVFAVHLAAMMPLIGIQFLRSGWVGRLACLVAGALGVNAIVLTRARGAVLALGGGIVFAVMAAPRRYRRRILCGVIVAAIAAYSLTDAKFWERANTITASEAERDSSAQSRVEIWQGAWRMLQAHPLGVGVARFEAVIRQYAPEHPMRDAHSTFVLCLGELGVHGFVLLGILVANAVVILIRTVRRSRAMEERDREFMTWMTYGVGCSLAAHLCGGLTITMLYVEGFWWLLAFPVCLSRASENALSDMASEARLKGSGQRALRVRRGSR